MVDVSDDLCFNILLDWKKRSIDPLEKSLFIKEMLKQKNLSQRELARRMQISHSTLQDWISMRQIEKHKNLSDSTCNSTIYSLADRLIFLLSKISNLSDKEFHKLKLLVSEIEKKDVISLED